MGRVVEAIKEAKGLWRIVVMVYIFQLILVSTVGLQMMQVLDASIGNSMSLEKFKTGFDYTVFTDFVNVHGGSFSVLYGQMRWMVLIYLIFASFISTGIIYCLAKGFNQISDFFKGGVQHFIKLFLLDIVFAFVILAILGVGIAIVGMLFGIAPTSFDSEVVFLRWTLLIAVIAVFLLIVLTLWKIKTKYHFVQSDKGVFTSLGTGFRSFWGNKWKSFGYALTFLLVSIFLIVLNYAAGDLPLYPMIFVIQIIALIKVFWRVAFYKVLED